jgi:hypothetical protein
MRTDVGDLWTYPADARCVTTNGTVRADGTLSVGAGTAAEAGRRYPGLAKYLGEVVGRYGNVPYLYPVTRHKPPGGWVVSFPTKERWYNPAAITTVENSARVLVKMADEMGWHTVVLPPPGCGAAELTWDQVRPVLEPLLDDRFVVLLPPGEVTP